MLIKDRLNISSKREYTDEGFLRVPARISRTGIQEYFAVEMGLTDRDPTDVVKIYRSPEEVFNEDSLKSFAVKPVTNNHPPELVTASNSKKYTVGISGHEITKDGTFVTALLNIIDQEAINAIESGKVELSNGYTADIEWGKGVTPEGEEYDAIQRNIKGNHIAIVEKGRAGYDCRVSDNLSVTGEKPKMKIIIDGIEFEVSDQVAQAVNKLQVKIKDMEKEVEKKEEEVEEKDEEMEKKEAEAKKTEDCLKAKLDDVTSKIPSAKQLDSMIEDRLKFVEKVKKLDPNIQWQGKDSISVMKEIVAAKCTNVQLDSVSDDYIKARFDTLLETTDADPLDETFKQVITNPGKVEDTRPAHVIAREKMMQDSRDAWKSPKGGKK